MRAISAFNFDVGTSTRACLDATALRTRVSMSEIGSVISLEPCLLPAALRDARHIALERVLAEAEPAEGELPQERPGPAALLAPVARADLVLERLVFPGDLGCGGHRLVAPERQPDQLQQLAGLF